MSGLEWMKTYLLAGGNLRVNGLERALVVGPAVQSAFKFNGRHAFPKVDAADARRL